MKTTARGDRLDWPTVRDRIDLAAVATGLLGPAPGRRGGNGRRLWWRCPFHDDQNPSFAINPGKRTWTCYGCGEHGDAANLVMTIAGMRRFPRPFAGLAEQAGILPPSGKPTRPRPPAASPPVKAPDNPPEQALGIAPGRCLEAGGGRRQANLDARGSGRPGLSPRPWTDRGDDQGRPPRVDAASCRRAVEAARRGHSVVMMLVDYPGSRSRPPDDGQDPPPEGEDAAEVRRSVPRPPRDLSRPRRSFALASRWCYVEGEFDALLLGQELADLAAVVTLGSRIGPPRGIDLLGDAARPYLVRRPRRR